MQKKIKVLLAYDHEIPLGGVSKSYKEAIIDPTNELIKLADDIGVKVNLFTDILCADFFKRNGELSFYDQYKNQLQETLRLGHDVQLHIHPHWIDSVFKDQLYKPSNSFKLADFKDKAYPNNIEGIVENSIKQLNEICLSTKADYKCIAYRAGGFNMWPETNAILAALFNNGIRIDSSIPKGLFFKSNFSTVDFRNMPEQCNWFISPQGDLNKPSQNGIWEVPIATINAGLWTNIVHGYRKVKYKERAFSTGKTIHSGKTKIIDKLRFVLSVRMLGFDLHTLSSDDLMRILNKNIKEYSSEKEIVLSTVSHPKNMGAYSRMVMKEFVDKARRKYGDAIDFPIFSSVYQNMIKTTA